MKLETSPRVGSQRINWINDTKGYQRPQATLLLLLIWPSHPMSIICQSGVAKEIKSLGLPRYNWWSEASSGVQSARNTETTKFPFPITTGPVHGILPWGKMGKTGKRIKRFGMG